MHDRPTDRMVLLLVYRQHSLTRCIENTYFDDDDVSPIQSMEFRLTRSNTHTEDANDETIGRRDDADVDSPTIGRR